MQLILRFVFVPIILVGTIFSQDATMSIDSIPFVEIYEPENKISSIFLTGHFEELVVTVGFPDQNPSYPTINSSSDYPPLGAFPDGTLLEDYVALQGKEVQSQLMNGGSLLSTHILTHIREESIQLISTL